MTPKKLGIISSACRISNVSYLCCPALFCAFGSRLCLNPTATRCVPIFFLHFSKSPKFLRFFDGNGGASIAFAVLLRSRCLIDCLEALEKLCSVDCLLSIPRTPTNLVTFSFLTYTKQNLTFSCTVATMTAKVWNIFIIFVVLDYQLGLMLAQKFANNIWKA